MISRRSHPDRAVMSCCVGPSPESTKPPANFGRIPDTEKAPVRHGTVFDLDDGLGQLERRPFKIQRAEVARLDVGIEGRFAPGTCVSLADSRF
jgi:hypothetical protein